MLLAARAGERHAIIKRYNEDDDDDHHHHVDNYDEDHGDDDHVGNNDDDHGDDAFVDDNPQPFAKWDSIAAMWAPTPMGVPHNSLHNNGALKCVSIYMLHS